MCGGASLSLASRTMPFLAICKQCRCIGSLKPLGDPQGESSALVYLVRIKYICKIYMYICRYIDTYIHSTAKSIRSPALTHI